MSITAALQTATSGLIASQMGLRTVSDNISNVNTPGYTREQVQQAPLVVNGAGMGVQVTGVARITDQYLQLASLTASSDANRYSVVSQYMDNVQGLFGDPSDSTNFFNTLDSTYTAFAAAANDPSNSLLRSQSLSDLQQFIGQAQRINAQVGQLRSTLDTRVQSDVSQATSLLQQINDMNASISRSKLVDQDASGSENIQSQLIDQLSKLMNVQVIQRPEGGVDIRSAEGIKLAGDGAAKLSYVATDNTHGYIAASTDGGTMPPQPITVSSGEISGLLDMRDNQLPGISDQLGEFVTQAAQQINNASNDSAAVPAPASLTGRDTGLDLTTAASNFTGKSSVAIVDSSGVIQQQVDIDFDAGTMTVGGVSSAFTPSTFLTSLNTALGAAGTATFSNGALSISASGGNGVAIDEGTSQKAGRGFSSFFGLNDIVRTSGISNYNSGLASTDANGFSGSISFQLAQPDGKPLPQVTVNMPAGGTMQDVVNALNSTSGGVGLYGAFSLDSNGALTFTGSAPANANISVTADTTQWSGGDASLSEMFGLGSAQRSTRLNQLSVDPNMVANPNLLPLAQLDTSVPAGQPALAPGDGSGALAISNSGNQTTHFRAAGALGALDMTVSRYAAEFSGAIGQAASNADTASKAAASVQTEADSRRQSVEGVNLDEELVNMTTYQQAFNASARMVQAAKDLFDTLFSIMG